MLVTEINLSFWKIFYPNKITSYILLGWLNVLHSTVTVLIWGLHQCTINHFLLIVKTSLFLAPSSILCLEFTRSICRKVFLFSFLDNQWGELLHPDGSLKNYETTEKCRLAENSGGHQVIAELTVKWTRSGFVGLFYSCITMETWLSLFLWKTLWIQQKEPQET